MGTFLLILYVVVVSFGFVAFGVMWFISHRRATQIASDASLQFTTIEAERQKLATELATLRAQVARLSKWAAVADADDKAREILANAAKELRQAERDAAVLVANAEQSYKALVAKGKVEAQAELAEAVAKARDVDARGNAAIAAATARATEIVAQANARAEEIAGEAMEAVRDADSFKRTARAMKAVIEGIGDEYLIPPSSLLDELADEYSHKEAGQQLKLARDHTKSLIKLKHAAQCDYKEDSRREGAEHFVIDAFNGKVDSILSRTKHDNYGKLAEEIRSAFELVNYGGKPFKDARITDEYLAARLAELKWGTIANQLKLQEQEEQRRIREQIREEEKARRDIEKAMREAARDEEKLRDAMVKAQNDLASATEAQKAKYEAQLAELNAKLQEAEAKNQRALSMAQQTRRGHVYIISNVGSFGDDVFKIGLTRRLDPMDRIWELGDASVPFDFDVHAIILSEDAPALECKLHRHFVLNQINKANHRKEFFRAKIGEIRRELEELGVTCQWTMMAEAREYRESQAIETRIAGDPSAKQAWISRQLELEVVQAKLAVDSEGLAPIA